MSDWDVCDFCGQPVGFYGCPKHGTDCYRQLYLDIGQPCAGLACDGGTDLCVDCDRDDLDWRSVRVVSKEQQP